MKVSLHHGLFVLQWNHKRKKKRDAGGVGVGQHIVQATHLSSLSLHQGVINGYQQRPVPECELTKPIFGYSDGKSMLIASTLIEV